MNRRSFLKSIAVACGAAVVCPGELLKGDPWIKAATLRKKNTVLGAKCKWKAYHNGGHFKSEAEYKRFLEKFRTAFKNTKFKPPRRGLTKIYESNGPTRGERSKYMYPAGVWI
ncbi:twin-arginine translocation signal domain-containing protein [Candidatus Pacearchaeota archaeon]|nr:twin-arginine translocation signal domain-containing protein [Candidatus Pacearchaeota archaeon]